MQNRALQRQVAMELFPSPDLGSSAPARSLFCVAAVFAVAEGVEAQSSTSMILTLVNGLMLSGVRMFVSRKLIASLAKSAGDHRRKRCVVRRVAPDPDLSVFKILGQLEKRPSRGCMALFSFRRFR
jgi:hypothetical protein